MEHNRDYFQRRISEMDSDRSSFITHWRELAEFIQPRRGRFLLGDQNRGEKRHQSIINSKATRAHRIAQAGLFTGIMSPSRPWFSLKTPDPGLMNFYPVKRWLHDVQTLLNAIFNSGNIYSQAPLMLGEALLFGTGALSHVDDFDDVARFYNHTVGSFWCAQNNRRQIDTYARQVELTTYQIVKEFGLENVSAAVKNAYDTGKYSQWFEVIQFIEPNPNQDDSKSRSRSKKYRSVYYEPSTSRGIEKDKFLRQSGFDEFPVYVARWETTDEDIYGTNSPAMIALGDIKGLQIEEKRKAQAIEKMVNPPMGGPASLRTVQVSTLPGSMNFYDADPSRNKLEPLYSVNPPLQHLTQDIAAVERRIDESFFVDLFMAISSMEGVQPKNQLELTQRNQERLLQLGPTLEHMYGQFLDLLIDRTFAQCVRANILPPAPPELEGKPLKVEYVSSLAMAQRSVATTGLERVAGFVGSLVAGGFPSAANKLAIGPLIDEYTSVVGAPPKIIVPDEEANAATQQQMQQMQMQRTAETAATGADAAKKLSEAKTADGSSSVMDGIAQVMRQRMGQAPQ